MKALVLFSGGVDSTTCLALAIDRYGKENVVALSVSYGQKHTKENQDILCLKNRKRCVRICTRANTGN